MYQITNRTKKNAKKLGVVVKNSTNPKKKIDVFKDNKKIATIGAVGYNDYPTFIKKKGKAFAEIRRKAYKSRHEKTRKVVGSPSYYADKLLWD